ncbi:hypothetical protein NP233_g10662 [Leucocoprinus birnbaumii]|uniref:Uncharacterized protein n=1 Tax=Leucocoprinus birnbaumii TaxID=56174 RepID=A0AAD5YL35_9AGAR|nr:hypothetical protein NP233_g10662 [Leucocoprinus birnbaumii]
MSLPHDAGSPSTGLETPHTEQTMISEQQPAGEQKKHFSIDLSLELERQLELEGSSPPATPDATASSHSRSHSQPHPDSLDPQILVHIITGLRKTVEDMTKERDDLLKLLENATTKEASLQDTLALMTEKATDYEEELSAAKKQMKEDEEAIILLRNKVEESRRGLMRLQAESRRQSVAPGALDLSRAAIPGLSNPPSSKRASFTPLTGRSNNGHRRVSSIGGDGNGLAVLQLLASDTAPSPNGQLSFQDSPSPGLGPPGSRRSLFLRSSPPNAESIPLPPTNAPLPAEVEAMKKELESLKRELADTRAELSEANEAKEASDTCVKALREFIAEYQVGEASSSGNFPPPPIATNGDDSDKKSGAASSGWGFKLWKADNAPKVPAVHTTGSTTSSTTTTTQSPAISAPFSRFGGFFSSRGSVSSTMSSNSVLQTNAALPRDSYRDSFSGRSVKSMSDESSLVEPASPENEYPGNVRVVVAPDIGESMGVNAMVGVPMEKDVQEVPVRVHVQEPSPIV